MGGMSAGLSIGVTLFAGALLFGLVCFGTPMSSHTVGTGPVAAKTNIYASLVRLNARF